MLQKSAAVVSFCNILKYKINTFYLSTIQKLAPGRMRVCVCVGYLGSYHLHQRLNQRPVFWIAYFSLDVDKYRQIALWEDPRPCPGPTISPFYHFLTKSLTSTHLHPSHTPRSHDILIIIISFSGEDLSHAFFTSIDKGHPGSNYKFLI